jgi:hypothetical protein
MGNMSMDLFALKYRGASSPTIFYVNKSRLVKLYQAALELEVLLADRAAQ